MRVVACPDKFRGTLTASQATAAIARGAHDAGVEPADVISQPMADGGEGMLEAFGGANRSATVVGPLGETVAAGWRIDGEVAVIEMAQAAGLVLAGGRDGNDPLAATTRGVGQLVCAALDEGATKIIVGVGGSATTDGGIGAVEELSEHIGRAEIVVACDVATKFTDAPRTFGPQKGASDDDIVELERRLDEVARQYLAAFGVDVRELRRAGAAGGLAGGLAALGAKLEDGFGVVAAEVGLAEQLGAADVVVTGEGKLDATSLEGKVPSGVAALAPNAALLVVAGIVDGTADAYAQQLGALANSARTQRPDAQPPDVQPPDVTVVSLTERFGAERALAETAECVSEAVAAHLRGHRAVTAALL